MKEERPIPPSAPSPPAPPERGGFAAWERTARAGCVWWGVLVCVVLALFSDSFPHLFLRDGPERTADTRVLAAAVVHAVELHLMETGGRFPPLDPPPGSGTDADTDTSGDSGLVADLLGKGPGSWREQDFLDGIRLAKPAPAAPLGLVNGVWYENGRYTLLDAWGLPLRVRLDTGGDGAVENPNVDQRAQGKTRLRKRVILWSAGKDGKWETWKDNVMSWE